MLITEFTIRKNGKTLCSEQGVKTEPIAILFWVGQKMTDTGLYAADFLTVKCKESAEYKAGEIIGASRSTKIRTTDGSVWETICKWEYEAEDLKYVLTEES